MRNDKLPKKDKYTKMGEKKGPGRPKGNRIKMFPRVLPETYEWIALEASRTGRKDEEQAIAAELIDEAVRAKRQEKFGAY